jgi:hypothetical protein
MSVAPAASQTRTPGGGPGITAQCRQHPAQGGEADLLAHPHPAAIGQLDLDRRSLPGWWRCGFRLGRHLVTVIGNSNADRYELRHRLGHQQTVAGLAPPLEHQAAVNAVSGRHLSHLHAGRTAFGENAEFVRHAPTTPPLAPGDDFNRPAAHDLTDDLTPDVKAASLNGRQRPGKAAEAGRLRCYRQRAPRACRRWVRRKKARWRLPTGWMRCVRYRGMRGQDLNL